MVRRIRFPNKSMVTAAVLAACTAVTAHATPMDPNVTPAPIELPGDLQAFQLLRDNVENIIYVAPREGRLGVVSGMPQLSYAKLQRDGQTFAMLNAMFDFAIDGPAFERIKAIVNAAGYRLKPIPFVQTTPQLAIAGYDAASSEGVCFEAEDIITGETKKSCMSLVLRSIVAQNGPSLGEKVQTSLVLSSVGAELFPKLLKGSCAASPGGRGA